MKKNITYNLIFLFLFYLNPPIVFADLTSIRSSSNILAAKGHDLGMGIGNYCEQIQRVQSDDKGSKNICTYRPFLSTEFFYKVGDTFHYGILLGSSFPQSPKDDTTHRMVVLAAPGMRFYYDFFHFQSLLGLQFTRIWGDGGEVTLNNGNSTQTFNVPNESRIARNMVWSIGAGYSLFDNVTLNSDLFVITALDKDKRAFSLLLQMKYHFGEIFL